MKKGFFIVFLLFLTVSSKAQNDTIWLDKYYQETTEDLAEYYRVFTEKSDKTFLIKEYYKSGKLFSEGTSTSKRPIKYIGIATAYTEDGFKFSEAEYKNNQLYAIKTHLPNGESFDFNSEERKGKAVYYTEKNNTFLMSEFVSEGKYILSTYRFDDKLNKILLVQTEYTNHYPSKSVSYDRNGKLVSECSYEEYFPITGIILEYHEKNAVLKGKTEYRNKVLVSEETYFPNGKIKKTTKTKNGVSVSEYYDVNGKKLGNFTENIPDGDNYDYESLNSNGIIVVYDEFTGEGKNISEIFEYKNGEVIKETKYDVKDNSKYTVKYYSDNYIENKKEHYQNGKLIATTTYNEFGGVINGIEEYENERIVYKNGKVIEKSKTYKNGKPFSERKGNTETFYDKDGKKLGSVLYDTNAEYEQIVSGDFYEMYNDEIIEYSQYQNNNIVKTITWEFDYLDTKFLKLKYIYANNGELSEKIEYYKNGKVASHVFYSNYYVKTKGEYFNEKGEKLGSMDFLTINGTEYEFFDDRSIRKIAKYENGKQTYEKLYQQITSSYDYSTSESKLIREVDFNKEGTFYFNGQTYKADYKDGLPNNGTVLESDEYLYKIISYKNGQIDGDVLTYDSYTNNVVKKENYKNGKPTGKVQEYNYDGNLYLEKEVDEYGSSNGIFKKYDKNGKLIEDLIYRQGQIVSGYILNLFSYDFFDEKNYSKIVYKDEEIETQESFRNGKLESKLTKIASKAYQNTYYYQNGNKKLTFNTEREYLNGSTIYFSENGKQLYKAEFKNGEYISGEFLVKTYDYEKILFSKTKKGFKAVGFDKQDKEVFELVETIKNDSKQSVILSNFIGSKVFTHFLYGVTYDGYDYHVEDTVIEAGESVED